MNLIKSKSFLIIIINLILSPCFAHHVNDSSNPLITSNKIKIVKDTGEYRALFSYYPIGDSGLIDFSIKIKEINSGFFFDNDIEIGILDSNGLKVSTNSPFLDNEHTFKIRQFFSGKGRYVFAILFSHKSKEYKLDFPFEVGSKRPDDICAWCSMIITNNKTVHYLSINSGEMQKVCCIHCAVDFKRKFNDKLISIETRDFYNNKSIDDNKAWFVKDSDINLENSMPPFVLAFSTHESAQDFQKEYSGTIVDFNKMESELTKINDPDFSANEIDELLLLEEFFYNIKKNYYKDIDLKKIVNLSIEKILELLDKDSYIKKALPSSLDFIRGFERDNTLQDVGVTSDGIGHIKINYFGRRTKEDFKKAIDNFSSPGIKGLIIDLRDNPGGSIEEALEIMQYFVPNGSLLATIKVKGEEKKYFSNTEDKWEYPTLILINSSTASSAEILAETLRYYNKAIIVGKNSYGKSSIQNVFPLNSENTLFLTTGKCYLANGKTIEGSGVTPDYIIDDENQQFLTAVSLLSRTGTQSAMQKTQ